MRIECELEETLVEARVQGVTKTMDGLVLTCGDCDHCVSRPGLDTPENREKLLEELRRTCPERECNRYVIVE